MGIISSHPKCASVSVLLFCFYANFIIVFYGKELKEIAFDSFSAQLISLPSFEQEYITFLFSLSRDVYMATMMSLLRRE